MFDEEEYGSDSSDDDYVPEEATNVSEDELSGVEEDFCPDDDAKVSGKRKNKKGADSHVRKRKGGIKLDGEEDKKDETKDEYNSELAKNIAKEKQAKKEEETKSRANDLWADFMKDVGPPKSKSSSSTGLGHLSSVSKPAVQKSASCTATASTSSSSATAEKQSKKMEKIKITKEFDFAGEIIKVTKEVDVNSKEAQAEIKKVVAEEKEKEPEKPTAGPSLARLGIKKPGGGGGGLNNLLGKLGKKPKMSTLEKSKLDWESFKDKEGISEDLAVHNRGKEGYIQRQQFLERTDLRQFEIEKNMRLTGKR